MSDLIKRLDDFKENYLSRYSPENRERINGIEKGLKKALLADNLAGHDGLKIFLERFRIEIEAINNTLITKRELTETERLFLFERRSWCGGFLRYFENAKATIKSTEKFLENAEDEHNNPL
jgi:hypothetical protein